MYFSVEPYVCAVFERGISHELYTSITYERDVCKYVLRVRPLLNKIIYARYCAVGKENKTRFNIETKMRTRASVMEQLQ